MKKIIILAGNRQQFEDYLEDNGLTDSQAVYGYEPDRMLGIEISRVEIIGTFWERKDAVDLHNFALSRVGLTNTK